MSSDPNLNHEAVRIYREMFLLCPNAGRRKDIVSTVEDIELWKTILSEWKTQKWNPLKVNWMLSEYERREQGAAVVSGRRSDQRTSAAQVGEVGFPKWSNGRMRDVREGTRVRLRASGETLEEVLTKALRQNNQPEIEVTK